jgi:hypothetical protein
VKGADDFNHHSFTFRIVDGRIVEGWEHLDSAFLEPQMRA